MGVTASLQPPLRPPRAGKAAPRRQIAVLPWRKRKGEVEICVVTSRGTRRWILPKGWPIPGRSAAAAAKVEAWEEAGLRGSVAPMPLGHYRYIKQTETADIPVVATLYGMRVTGMARNYPERGQRKRKWLSPKKAAARLTEPDLAQIVRSFDPGSLPD